MSNNIIVIVKFLKTNLIAAITPTHVKVTNQIIKNKLCSNVVTLTAICLFHNNSPLQKVLVMLLFFFIVNIFCPISTILTAIHR